MRRLIIFVFILFCVNIFAQKTYTFDYYVVYEFRANEKDSVPIKDITIANSKNSNYFIKISTNNKNTYTIVLYDIENKQHYNFFSGVTINENTDFSSLFNNPVPFHFNLKLLKKKAIDKHDVIYQNDTIIVRRYKNKRKKKIILDYFFIMESNEITKNQFYTSNLTFSYKFDITKVKTDKVIKESYVITYNNKKESIKENIRTLIDIQPTDFKLNIPKETNTTN